MLSSKVFSSNLTLDIEARLKKLYSIAEK